MPNGWLAGDEPMLPASRAASVLPILLGWIGRSWYIGIMVEQKQPSRMPRILLASLGIAIVLPAAIGLLGRYSIWAMIGGVGLLIVAAAVR